MSHGLIIAVIGVALLLRGMTLFANRRRLSRSGETTTGTVVCYTRRTRSRRYTYMPHVRFQSPKGERTFVSSMSADPAKWPEGTTVPVRFLPNNPDHAEIATTSRMWLAPALFCAGGLVALGSGTAAYWIV